MNTVMKRYEKRKLVEDYLTHHDIYNPRPIGYKLKDMYEYASSKGKTISELHPAEAQMFAVKS